MAAKTYAIAGDFYWLVKGDTPKEAADKIRAILEYAGADDFSVNEVKEEA